MARFEQDREDLIREATALVDRCELVIAHEQATPLVPTALYGDSGPTGGPELSGGSEAWVVGVRAGGAVSLYFGAERVYHFNTAGQLRRAYVGGRLWKAERGALVGLERRRSAERVELVRHVMPGSEQREWLDELDGWLARLAADWTAGRRRVSREVGRAGGVMGWWLGWRDGLPRPIEVAARPHVEGPGGRGSGSSGAERTGMVSGDRQSVDRGQRGT